MAQEMRTLEREGAITSNSSSRLEAARRIVNRGLSRCRTQEDPPQQRTPLLRVDEVTSQIIENPDHHVWVEGSMLVTESGNRKQVSVEPTDPGPSPRPHGNASTSHLINPAEQSNGSDQAVSSHSIEGPLDLHDDEGSKMMQISGTYTGLPHLHAADCLPIKPKKVNRTASHLRSFTVSAIRTMRKNPAAWSLPDSPLPWTQF